MSDFFIKKYNECLIFFFCFYAFLLLSATMYIAVVFFRFSLFPFFLFILRLYIEFYVYLFMHIAFTVYLITTRTCVCNGALYVVNVKAQFRDIEISSSVFSCSSPCGSGAIIFCESSERETARGGQRSARHGGIICDGSRIRSFARKGTMDKINGKWGECRVTRRMRLGHAEEWLCIICLVVIPETR